MNFYNPNSRSNQWLPATSFRAMAPTVKSFSCSRWQGREDWRCLADWGIQAKGLAGKRKCDHWEIQRKSAFSRGDAGQCAGQWHRPFTCLNATAYSNFTRRQEHSRSKKLPLGDMNSSFTEKGTFHWWSFVILWNKILARFKDLTFTDVNYMFPGTSVLIDNQSFSEARRLLSCLWTINCDCIIKTYWQLLQK